MHALTGLPLLDYLIPLFSFLAITVRFKDELRAIGLFFNICLFLTQMAKVYFKETPKNERRFNRFMAHVVDHYFRTHPKGRQIAKKGQLDEKLDKLFKKYRLRHDNEVEGLG